jgi:hypothetical protein
MIRWPRGATRADIKVIAHKLRPNNADMAPREHLVKALCQLPMCCVPAPTSPMRGWDTE